jgi:hypothetical protein
MQFVLEHNGLVAARYAGALYFRGHTCKWYIHDGNFRQLRDNEDILLDKILDSSMSFKNEISPKTHHPESLIDNYIDNYFTPLVSSEIEYIDSMNPPNAELKELSEKWRNRYQNSHDWFEANPVDEMVEDLWEDSPDEPKEDSLEDIFDMMLKI